MHPALTIAVKDLRERFRDRSVLILGLLAPLGLALIFGALFGGTTVTSLNLRFGVHDADGGALAEVFTQQVLAGLDDQDVATITGFTSADDARAAVEAGELTAAFLLPEGFTEAVTTGGPVGLDVVGSADAPIGSQVAESVAASFAAELTAVQLAVAAALGPVPDGGAVDAVAAEMAARPAPLRIGLVEGETRELDPVTYLSAGMAVFFVFFTVSFGITSLLEERRLGTLPRLFAAPVPRGAVYAAKGLASMLLGLVAMTVLVVSTDLLVGARWGDPLGVALIVVGGVVAATGLMAALATFARDAQQASTWQTVTAVLLGALGGAFFPVAPGDVLEPISLLTPHRWFLRGLAQLADGGPASAAVPAFVALVAFGLLGVAVAVVRLRTVEELS